jgi:hypothetical protein
MRTRLFYATFAVLALSSSAIAQTTVDPAKPLNPTLQQLTAPNPETYGTASEVVIAVPDFEFNPADSFTTSAWVAGKYITSAGGLLDAGLHVPTGASVTRIELQACNTNGTSPGNVYLETKSNSTGYGTLLAQAAIGANTGCGLFPVTLSPAHTVNNAINSYYLVWSNGIVTDGTIKIQAVRVFYKLQVSPPPTTATFADVPVGHPFHRFVEALYASGITAGCGNGNFCPDQPVTRGQMAVFLSAALGLHWAP